MGTAAGEDARRASRRGRRRSIGRSSPIETLLPRNGGEGVPQSGTDEGFSLPCLARPVTQGPLTTKQARRTKPDTVRLSRGLARDGDHVVFMSNGGVVIRTRVDDRPGTLTGLTGRDRAHGDPDLDRTLIAARPRVYSAGIFLEMQ